VRLAEKKRALPRGGHVQRHRVPSQAISQTEPSGAKPPQQKREETKRKTPKEKKKNKGRCVFWKEGKKHDEPRERTRTAGSLASLRAKGRLRLLATREVIKKKQGK